MTVLANKRLLAQEIPSELRKLADSFDFNFGHFSGMTVMLKIEFTAEGYR